MIKMSLSVTKLLTVDDVINFKIFLESTSKAMGDIEKKRRIRKYKDLNILRTKELFR